MFDIAFSELLVIGVVALVVIGPERLPKVARTLGTLFGRLQRYVAQVKADVNREMEMSELSKVKTEFETAARDFQRDIETKVHDTEREIREVQADIDRQFEKAPAPADGPAQATLPAAASDSEAAASVPEATAAPSPSAASAQLELAIDEPAGAASAGRAGTA
jgi:sec-independent protein translocase protein TatB